MWSVSVYLLLLVLLLIEYLVIPVPLQETPSTSEFYEELAAEPGTFAVLNLPFDSLKAKTYMFEQVTHHRPLMQGNMSRIPPSAYRTIDSNPWLSTLRHSVEMDPIYRDVSRQLASLTADGVRYVIMHKDLVGADRIQHWQRYLLTRPFYEDDKIIVYRTDPQIDEDFALEKELIPGLGPVRVMISADCVALGRILEIDVGWGSSAAVAQDYQVELALVDSRGSKRFVETWPLSEAHPSSTWLPLTLIWDYYKLPIPENMTPGAYDLVLSLQHTTTGAAAGEPYLLQEVWVNDGVCHLEPVEDAVNVNATFGDQLRLLAYDFEQDDQMALRLYWQADQRMDSDYKIFIHVFDLNTAVPVAQDDAMPHRNAYPTRFWGLEEVVEDHIRIPLRDVPPGSYGLAIGVYDPVSGERLEAVDGDGEMATDGRLVLPETVSVK